MAAQAFNDRDGGNRTSKVATEAYHKSERIELPYMLNGQRLVTTILVSELKEADLNNPSIVGIWVVKSNVDIDSPKTPETLGEKLLIAGIRTILSGNNFSFTTQDPKLYIKLTHPEKFEPSSLIVLQHSNSASDSYQTAVDTIKTYADPQANLKFTSLETIGRHNSPMPKTIPSVKLVTALITKYPKLASKLVGLSNQLEELEESDNFSIANATRIYLEQQRLSNIVPEAMALLRKFGGTESVLKSMNRA